MDSLSELPCFSVGLSQDDGLGSQPVDIHEANVRQRQQESLLPVSSYFELAWSLTIHLYTGAKTVAFQRITENTTDQVQLRLCTDLDRPDTLESIYSRLSDNISHPNRQGCGLSNGAPCNTAVHHVPEEDGDVSLREGLDLSLRVSGISQSSQKVHCRLLYRRRFMSSVEAERVAAVVSHIIKLCQGRQTTHLQELLKSVCTGTDLDTILRWNTKHELKTEKSLIPELFSNVARKFPDMEALAAWDGIMTYGDLDRVSSDLAVLVAGRFGVQAHSNRWVGLCFEKSLWAVVAMLAALKAGASCFFLDPAYPEQRCRQILEATGAHLVMAPPGELSDKYSRLPVTDKSHHPDVLSVPSSHIEENSTSLGESGHLTSQVDSGHVAFAMFTSGSTGTPKGVLLTHRNICSSVASLVSVLNLDQPARRGSRLLQFAAYTFDASLSEIFTALLSGATICIPPEADRREDLQAYMQDQKISLAFLTPTVARFVEPAPTKPHLKQLVLLGEMMLPQDKERWLQAGIVLYNGYGPTEATFGASMARCHDDIKASNIGHALNYSFWIVSLADDEFKAERYLVPIGARGELFLEGPGLALGYLNDDEETRASFLSSPSWLPVTSKPGTGPRRVYRTRDMVRYCQDGSLEYLGRVGADTQVKLAGQRLELTEVELHLGQIAGLYSSETTGHGDLAVCLPTSGPLRQHLTAVLTQSQHTGTDVQFYPFRADEKIRFVSCLADRVPGWMIPSTWLRVNHLPTTVSGKRDRRTLNKKLESLSEVEYLRLRLLSSETNGNSHSDAQDLDGARAGKKTELHPRVQMVRQICSEVLRIPAEHLSMDRSLIHLGGDSIIAMRISTRLRREVDLHLSVGSLLTCASLEEAASTAETREKKIDDPGDFDDVRDLRQKVVSSRSPWLNVNDIEDVYPCTPMQESLIVTQLKSTEPIYRVSSLWWVAPGDGLTHINTHRLGAAWTHVVQTHPAMRTVILELPDASNTFVQVVLKRHRPITNRFHVAGDEEKALAELMQYPSANCSLMSGERLSRTQDSVTPPYQIWICSVGQSRRGLIRLDVNHALLDGISATALLRHVAEAYHRLEVGPGEAVSPCPTSLSAPKPASHPVRDFLKYTRQHQRQEASVEYWKNYLAGVEPCIFPELIDTASESITGDAKQHSSVSVPLASLDLHQLRALLQDHGATLNTFFLLVWSLVLRIYTGSSQVLCGYVSSGRDVPVDSIDDDAVGCFISMCISRARFSELEESRDITLAGLLKQIQLASVDGASHQSASLADIQKAVSFEGSRLFNTTVSFTPLMESHARPGAALLFDDVLVENPTEFDLSLVIGVGLRSLQASLSYRCAYVSAAHTQNIAMTVRHIVNEIMRSPGHSVLSLLQLDDDSLASINGWNCAITGPVRLTVNDSLERSMAVHADKEAVFSWDGALTYRELHGLSARLAGHLRYGCGVTPETRVLIYMPKSLWVVVSLMAVLRSGGCFVILDSTWPESRLFQIVDSTEASLLLCSHLTRDKVENLRRNDGRVLEIVEVSRAFVQNLDVVNGQARLRAVDTLTPDNAAYVIYTSGSTGTPKGTVVSHQAMSTATSERAALMRMSPRSRVLLLPSVSFVLAIDNVLTTTLAGGCLCLPSPEQNHSVHGVVSFIAQSRANWMACTSSFLSLFKGDHGPRAMPTMEVILLGGEALAQPLLDVWAVFGGRTTLMNGYGVSECALGGCIFNRNITPQTRRTNMGRGLRALTWIVDEHNHNQLKPIGAVGELLLEGPCLAREYLGQPEVTSQAFIDSPPWHLQGRAASGRLYKTGDLVRYGAGGELHYMGRKDSQVKVNGIRTELAAVESLVCSLLPPKVLESTQIVIELVETRSSARESSDTNMLVGFVHVENQQDSLGADSIIGTPTEGFLDVVRRIQEHAKDAAPLSRDIIPHVFVPLAILPKQTSGKVDRKNLKRAASQLSREQLLSFTSKTDRRPPKTVQERQLADVWRKILQVEEVGCDDSFFQLGGDSLSAMALRAAVRRAMRVDLTIPDIFASQTLEVMATKLKGAAQNESSEVKSPKRTAPCSLVPGLGDDQSLKGQLLADVVTQCGDGLRPGDIQDVFPCTPMQEALMTLTVRGSELDEKMDSGDTRPYSLHAAYRLTPGLDLDRFRKAWDAAVRTFDILRSRIVFLPDHGSLLVVLNHLTQVKMLTSTESLRDHMDRIRQSTTFHYGTALFHAHTLATPGEAYLVISAHHAVYDGWSLNLMWDSVMRAYHTNTEQPGPDGLPHDGPRFADFVKYIRDQSARKAEGFWRASLQGGADETGFQFPHVPAHHRPRAQRSASFTLQPPAPEWRRASQNMGLTLATFVHAAWAVVLAQYSSSPVVTFGSTRTGRDIPMTDVAKVVGPTMTTVPVQFTLKPARETALGFLRQIQATLVASGAHQHFGLQQIQRLSPEARRACNYGSLLTVQTPEDDAADWGGPSPRRPSVDPEIVLVEPVDTSGFHPLPLVLEFFSDRDLGHLTAEVSFDAFCLSDGLLRAAMQQFDHILTGLWRAVRAGSTSAPLASIMTAAPAHISMALEWHTGTDKGELERQTMARKGMLLHQNFEAMAVQQPEAQAVVAHDGSYSYAELDEATSALACEIGRICTAFSGQQTGTNLHKTTERAEVIVGHCFDHSASAVVAMMAVLKAGCAFVPLSPNHPPERLAQMVQSTSCRLILASPRHVGYLRFDVVARVNALECEVMAIDSVAITRLLERLPSTKYATSKAAPVSPKHLAYVLFTSGSTGQPKGVLVEHGASGAAVTALAARWGLGRHTRRLQFTDYSFDNSVEDIFGTLGAGGCVCVPSEPERLNNVVAFCRARDVNSLHVTPSVLRLFFDASGGASCGEHLEMQSVVIGGEAATRMEMELLQRWASVCKGLKAFLAYGSTEVCIDCTAREIVFPSMSTSEAPRVAALDPPELNIGRSISPDLWRTWIVSPLTSSLAPVGAVGELYVEGPCLARGYLDMARQTDERFVAGFSLGLTTGSGASNTSPDSARAWRTGDLVRHQEDGSLVYLGRSDSQVKLNGKRVDLGEIEDRVRKLLNSKGITSFQPQAAAGVCQHGQVYAFLVRSGTSDDWAITEADLPLEDDSTLVGTHLSSKIVSSVLTDKLRHVLSDGLPEFMIPRQFGLVSTLPITPSGKRDQRRIRTMVDALCAWHKSNSGPVETKSEAEEPSSKQALLQRWWASLLPEQLSTESRVSAEAHFFEKGASSITAIQLATLARSSGYSLRYEDIFSHPVLGDMAKHIHESPRERHVNIHGNESTEAGKGWCSELLGRPDQDIELVQREITAQYGIPKTSIQDVYPCGPLQEVLMAGTVRTPGAFIMAECVRVPRHLALSDVKAAFAEVFDHFETFRSCIVHIPATDIPVQVVLKHPPPWEETESAGAFVEAMRRDHDYGEPLVRLAFVRQETREKHTAEVVLAAHHAAYDGPALDVFWRMVNQRLQIQQTGLEQAHKGPASPVTPTRFRDFIRHMHRNFDREAARDWWRAQLDGFEESSNNFPPGIPSLPKQYRPLARSSHCRVVSLSADKIKTMPATLASIARAAWSLTLSYFTATSDPVYGCIVNSAAPFIGDSATNLTRVAGPTSVTIPSRSGIDLSDKKLRISDLLAQVQQQAVNEVKFAYLGVPGIATLSPACRKACEFSTIFLVQHTQAAELDSGRDAGITDAAPHTIGAERARLVGAESFYPHPVVVSCYPLESKGGQHSMRIVFLNDPAVVADEKAEFVLCTLATLLQNLVEAPAEAPVTRVSALSETSWGNILDLVDRNGQPTQPVRALLHDLVRSKARSQPLHAAIDGWDGSMSYKDLDREASRWASRLASRLRLPRKRRAAVPLLLDKSKWVVVAMLAILKAGCYYVPLDPHHPTPRLQTIVKNAGASLIVTQRKHLGTAEALGCDGIFLLEDEVQHDGTDGVHGSHGIEYYHCTDMDPATDTAYVLFTSGSTGTPKGVIVNHGPLCTTLTALGQKPPLNRQARFVQFSNFIFDVSVYEIFVTLLSGATICIPSEDERLDNLEGFMHNFAVTDALLTPSVSRVLNVGAIAKSTPLRRLRVAGEALTKSDHDRWTGPGLDLHFIGMYGPTEGGIINYYVDFTDTPRADHRVLGWSLNCRSWVVNPLNDSELAPPGAIGELYLEGPMLAMGYLGDPIQTEAAFLVNPRWRPEIPNTWSRDSAPEQECEAEQVRVYKTGDLVHFNLDGTLSYVRRKDLNAQIKLRGLRIELGEIEHTIQDILAASEAAIDVNVVVDLFTPHGTDNKVLGAALVGAGRQRAFEYLNLHQIRALMAQRLPGYMVPHHLIPFTKFPLSRSGKLDRPALRELMASSSSSMTVLGATHDGEQELQTDNERLIRDLIFQVLRIPIATNLDSTRSANFFILGGDSICAIRLVSLLRARGFSLHVADVFQDPTIGGIASKLKKFPSAASKKSTLTAEKTSFMVSAAAQCGVSVEDIERVYPCTPTQQLLATVFSRFVFSVGPLDRVAMGHLKAAIGVCVSCYPILRTRIVQQPEHSTQPEASAADAGTRLTQVVLKSDCQAARVKLNWTGGGGVQEQISGPTEQQQQLEFGFGKPLYQLALLSTTMADQTNPDRLVWTLSHALYDAWSLNLMLRSIEQAWYSIQAPALHAPPLASLGPSLPFEDFVRYQVQRGGDAAHVHFWASRLAGITLPQKQLLGYSDPELKAPVRDARARYRLTLPARTLMGPESGTAGASAATVIAACVRAVGDAISLQDLVIGYTVSGRTAPLSAIEACVGPTLGQVPLRVRLSATVGSEDVDLDQGVDQKENRHWEGNEKMTTRTTQKKRRRRATLVADTARVQRELAHVRPYEISGADALDRFRAGSPLPLELVVQPRSMVQLENMDASPDAVNAPSLRLEKTEPLRAMPGGFLMQCTLLDDNEVELTANWDRRAATTGQIDKLVGSMIDAVCV